MKTMKKIVALAIVAMMVLALGGVAFAAKTADSGKSGEATITITLPTDNAGTDEEITYTVYKVFEATTDGTAISYKIDSANGDLSAAMTAAGFFLDDGGNIHYGTFTEAEDGTYMVGGKKGTITDKTELDDAALAAIAAYATDKIGEFKAKPSDTTLAITGLQYGYYYITTTTGTVVTVDSTKPNASVQDKNAIPGPPDKTITGVGDGSLDEAGKNALAQVGTTVNFKVEITKVKGATNYVFHDIMSAGLQYNNDVAVDPAAVVDNTTTASGDTVTVTFKNDELAKLADNTTITITYSATVTSDALSTDFAHNTATLDYGNGHTTEMDQVKVYNAKFTVTKQDGDKKPLAGAGFVIAKSVADTSEGAAEDATKLQYYKIANNVVTWVDSIDDATEYTSNAQGAVPAFTGLANGTYTLIEKTVPDGYNKAADSTFTVAEKNYTAANLEQTATVINESGATLPSTGGMGTTILYIAGAILVLGAGILLVTKRRMN